MTIKMTELKTNQIIIEVDDEAAAYELFEEIQNKYSLYDNCVIDTGVELEDSIVDFDRTEESNGYLSEEHNKKRRELKTG